MVLLLSENTLNFLGKFVPDIAAPKDQIFRESGH